MRKIHSKLKLFFYAMGGMGVNMLNLVIGSYLCDALMVEGFDTNIEMWTYSNKTLVVAAVWSVMITVAKVIDGVIDIPLATLSDNLRTRWGKRRPAILMGLVPMMLAFVAFLNPISSAEHDIGNTIWLGIMLCHFYAFYTLTMGTYYATFAEIVDNDKDRITLSNYKTIFDIIYFVMGYGLIPFMVGSQINIRIIGYIFLPLALTMLIPIFMIKEKPNRKKDLEAGITEKPEETVGLIKSFKYCVTNKSLMIWMAVYAALQFGLQIFITGQNVYYSGTMQMTGMQITVIMAAVFAPVPGTIFLYNHMIKKRGLKAGFLYSLGMFIIAMTILSLCNTNVIPDDTARFVVAIIGGLIASFGIGCFFSISYTIPSALADIERKQTGISHPTMYFAVQGLFSGIATAIATGLVWVNLKDAGLSWTMPIFSVAASVIAFGLTFFMPKSLGQMGKAGVYSDAVMEPASAPAADTVDADGVAGVSDVEPSPEENAATDMTATETEE